MTHNNIDAEYATLGLILLHNREDWLNKLDAKYFTDKRAITAYNKMIEVQKTDRPIDMVNTGIATEDGMMLISKTSLTNSFQSGLVALLEAYLLRSSQQLGVTLIDHLKSSSEAKQIVKMIEATLEEYKKDVDHKSNIYSISELLGSWMANIQEKKSDQKGLGWCIPGLEEYEIKPGHLCSVVARAKAGKTTMMCQQALHALQEGYEVLFISLEMSEVEVADKIIAYYSDVNPIAVQKFGEEGQSTVQQDKIAKGVQGVSKLPLTVYHASYPSVAELDGVIKRFKDGKDKTLIIIDQLQFINSARDLRTKVLEYDYILARLKRIAISQQVPIVLAHQLNRNIESRGWKYPMTSDIKDSGRVEEVSDLLILFAQDKERKDIRLCTVVSRHYAGCQVTLDWEPKKAKFSLTM